MTATIDSSTLDRQWLARPRGRGHPHHPRGRRPVRAAGAAVLRRQGLDRDAAPGGQGVLAGSGAVLGDARRHRPQLPRGDRVPRSPPGLTRASTSSSPACRNRSTPAGSARSPASRATRCRPPRCSTRSTRTSSTPYWAAPAATKRRREPRSASSACATTSGSGIRVTSAPSSGTSTTAGTGPGEHVRVFPLSNWTELDIWSYIEHEGIDVPNIYYAHERPVFERDGMVLAVTPWTQPADGETVTHRVGALPHRRRRDLHRRGALASRPTPTR